MFVCVGVLHIILQIYIQLLQYFCYALEHNTLYFNPVWHISHFNACFYITPCNGQTGNSIQIILSQLA